MRNFVFELTVYESGESDCHMWVIAKFADEAQQVANRVAAYWWGYPGKLNVESDGDMYWVVQNETEAQVPAVPTLRGEFTHAEMMVVARAVNIQPSSMSEGELLDILKDAADGGLEKPEAKDMSVLFGEAFAARCEVEIQYEV